MGNRHWRLLLIGVLCIGLLSSRLASAQSFGMAYDRGYREGVQQGEQDGRQGREPQWERSSIYRDADDDGVGAGARTMACLGRGPSAGFSFKGYDPNDDADDPGAVLVSDIDLPPALMMSPEDADEDFP